MSDVSTAPVNDALRSRLDRAVTGRTPQDITSAVKAALQDALRDGSLTLSDRFKTARADTYARRLLHRDPGDRYTMVVMTWGPGQGTALHDHAGIWCVECVVDGEMEVAQFERLSEDHDTFTFAEQSRIRAGRGSAGCLIPPFEYHTLANAAATPSITLHVYGGEMDHCHVFEPSDGNTWRRVRRNLAYHD